MENHARVEHLPAVGHHEKPAANALFNDAYDATANALSINSADVAIGAAAVALTIGALYLTRGRALASAARDGVELGLGRGQAVIKPALEGVTGIPIRNIGHFPTGMPVTAHELGQAVAGRAMLTNETVALSQPWLRRLAVKGGAEYLEARSATTLPNNLAQIQRDSWMGQQARAMSPDTITALSREVQAGKLAGR